MSHYRDAILATPDLVAYWRLAGLLDEGPGSHDLTDVAGGLAPAAGLLVGDLDGANEFFGVDERYLQSPALPALGTAYSLAAWIRPDLASSGIFVSGGGSRPYLRHLNSDITFAFTDSGGAQVTFTTPADDAPIGVPIFVVATHDGATARIYVDGIERAVDATASQAPGALSFRIGRWGAAGLPFDGVVDEAAIVGRALGPGEIAHLYAAGTSKQPAPAPEAIETWITQPDGTYIAHLDRSLTSPFRRFTFYVERAIDGPGGGSFEYHPDNAILVDHPTLLAKGNLVWMRYRGRTVTWIVEQDQAALGSSEHAGDWRVVAGAGVLQLLADRIVFPPDFAAGANLDPVTWATQWREAINVAAGSLLWDLIDESNARFAAQITQGTVETTGSDGVTVRHRFENLLDDVVAPVLELHGGSVVMDGLEFNYFTDHGSDRRDSVIFEEGADVRELKVSTSEREAVSWVVGEGVGEGVFAKLAIATSAAARRREAYLAAKDAGNVPLLQLMTDAALAENGPVRGLELTVDESRFRAFDDYDLDDVVRVVAASREVDDAIEVVALYVGEEGDRISVSVDLGLVREDDELRLDRRLRETKRNLGIRDRQPQGQLVPYPIMGQGLLDTGHPFRLDFLVPDSIFVLVRVLVQLSFSEFTATATAAASGGGATSGASSASSSASGGSSTPTSSNEAAHRHRMFRHLSSPGSGLGASRDYDASNGSGGNISLDLSTVTAADLHTFSADGSHSHSVTIGGHVHNIEHTHSVPAHVHGLDYGMFEEAMPASIDAIVGVYKRNGSSWDLVTSISGLTDEVEDLDLTQWIDSAGSWRLAIESAGGALQGGRLAVSVAGSIEGAIQSR